MTQTNNQIQHRAPMSALPVTPTPASIHAVRLYEVRQRRASETEDVPTTARTLANTAELVNRLQQQVVDLPWQAVFVGPDPATPVRALTRYLKQACASWQADPRLIEAEYSAAKADQSNGWHLNGFTLSGDQVIRPDSTN